MTKSAKKPAKKRQPTKKTTAKGSAKPRVSAKNSAGGWSFGRVAKWSAVTAIWGVIALLAVVGWAAYDLPDIDFAMKSQRPPSVTILASDGAEIATRGGRYGQAVHVDDVPKALVQAVLATEDRRFYDHLGVDPIGILRAMVTNVFEGRIKQGGSTITQQVAKNLFLSSERSYKRKLQEVLIAGWLEARYSKDQILTLYLNRVYLGAGTYGVSAAAERYFGRRVQSLGVYESAMLAGLLKAPSRYSPRTNLKAAETRTDIVLANMVAAGYLDEDAMRAAKEKRLAVIQPRGGASDLGYFTDWVLDIARDISPEGGDLVVMTTLDLHLQRLAEEHIQALLNGPAEKANAGQAALVAMGPDGAVRAMVGGGSYRESPFNRATQAQRQPGSAFKPFVFLAGLEQGLTPNSLMDDAPVKIKGWEPQNFSKNYAGAMTLRDGFKKSLNTVAVRVSEYAGRKNVADVAERLGVRGTVAAHPSIALGVSEVSLLDLTGAYAPFANGGIGVWAYGIDEILTPNGQVVYRRSGSGPGRVVAAENIGPMNDMFAAVINDGTGRKAFIARPAGGKTGTSQNFRDAWFVGFTPDLITGVWFGNDNAEPMKRVTGGGLPAIAWSGFMRDALAGTAPRPLPGYDGSTAPDAPAIVKKGSDQKLDDGFFDNFFDLMRADRG